MNLYNNDFYLRLKAFLLEEYNKEWAIAATKTGKKQAEAEQRLKRLTELTTLVKDYEEEEPTFKRKDKAHVLLCGETDEIIIASETKYYLDNPLQINSLFKELKRRGLQPVSDAPPVLPAQSQPPAQSNLPPTRKCLNCNTLYQPRTKASVYCSDLCKVQYNRKKNSGALDVGATLAVAQAPQAVQMDLEQLIPNHVTGKSRIAAFSEFARRKPTPQTDKEVFVDYLTKKTKELEGKPDLTFAEQFIINLDEEVKSKATAGIKYQPQEMPIKVGSIIRTNYNTGPYKVIEVSKPCTCPKFLEDKPSKSHYHFVCVNKDHQGKPKGIDKSYLGGYACLGDRILSVWGDNDEIFIEPEETPQISALTTKKPAPPPAPKKPKPVTPPAPARFDLEGALQKYIALFQPYADKLRAEGLSSNNAGWWRSRFHDFRYPNGTKLSWDEILESNAITARLSEHFAAEDKKTWLEQIKPEKHKNLTFNVHDTVSTLMKLYIEQRLAEHPEETGNRLDKSSFLYGLMRKPEIKARYAPNLDITDYLLNKQVQYCKKPVRIKEVDIHKPTGNLSGGILLEAKEGDFESVLIHVSVHQVWID